MATLPFMAQMGKPRIDAAAWPIVVIEWPEGTMASGDLTGHFEDMSLLLKKHEGTMVAILDASKASALPPVLRAHAADALRAFVARASTRVGGVAYVAPNVFVRGIITALHWLAPVPCPTSVWATRAEAMSWVATRATRRSAVA